MGTPRVDDGVMNDLMEIGKFATASGLSVNALRHYDEVGILKPASVDQRTSYRRYHAAQLRDARLICQLRGVDLPVEEVRTVLQADGPEQVQEILHRHQRRLTERTDALERMLATSAAYVEKGIPLPPPRACRVVQVMVSTRDRDESVRFYQFEFLPSARRELMAIEQPVALHILTHLARLGDDPYRTVKTLTSGSLPEPDGLYRLRITASLACVTCPRPH